MSDGARWGDLGQRVGVGLAIGLVGLAGVWIGGAVFAAITVLIAAVMVWELVRMLDADAPAVAIALGAGTALAVAEALPPAYATPLLLLPVFAGLSQLSRRRGIYALFTLMIVVAAFGLYALRQDFGFVWMLWLGLVVMVTDVFGYFAGRKIGGPKMWPRVSPKKTWSGTVAGWVGAAIVGALVGGWAGAGPQIVAISVAVSMASQLGDIAQSAVKRHVGVKDSSSLLPGHGGLFDRFDGMLGAAVFLLLIEQIVDFPPGAGGL